MEEEGFSPLQLVSRSSVESFFGLNTLMIYSGFKHKFATSIISRMINETTTKYMTYI